MLYSTSVMEHHHFDHCIMILNGEVNTTSFHLLLSCQHRVTVMSCFVYKVSRDLESIDHLCINPILKWSVQVNVLLNICKHNITSLSLLAGRTVVSHINRINKNKHTSLHIFYCHHPAIQNQPHNSISGPQLTG